MGVVWSQGMGFGSGHILGGGVATIQPTVQPTKGSIV